MLHAGTMDVDLRTVSCADRREATAGLPHMHEHADECGPVLTRHHTLRLNKGAGIGDDGRMETRRTKTHRRSVRAGGAASPSM